jgi:hypothetical protein
MVRTKSCEDNRAQLRGPQNSMTSYLDFVLDKGSFQYSQGKEQHHQNFSLGNSKLLTTEEKPGRYSMVYTCYQGYSGD